LFILLKLKTVYESKCGGDTFWSNKTVRLLWRMWGEEISDHTDRWCLLREYGYILTLLAYRNKVFQKALESLQRLPGNSAYDDFVTVLEPYILIEYEALDFIAFFDANPHLPQYHHGLIKALEIFSLNHPLHIRKYLILKTFFIVQTPLQWCWLI